MLSIPEKIGGEEMKKLLLFFVCIISLVALAIWAPNVYAFEGFDDGGGEGVPACAVCHPDLANFGPDHPAHAELSNSDCNSCHVNSGGPGNNNPPLANCVRCHGRDDDGNPSADFSAGIGRGLRQHHVTVGVAACGNCHQDTDHAATGSAPEDVMPSFYPQALGGTGLDPCDGSEENFPSNSVSLDNDGDGLTDGADPDCGPPPECTIDADCDDGVFCTVDTCDTNTGTCTNTPDDTACDDGNVCNGAESCDAVNDCQAGTELDCDDGDLCTNDGCDPVAGCVNDPVMCPAGQQCDPGTGECVTPPGCVTDADCDDGLFCNGAEVCDVNGECQSGTAPDCDDGVTCTVDTCDEVNDGCANTPDDNACDDGLFCTGQEVCDPLNDCVSTGDPCPSDTECNEDTNICDPVTDRVTVCHIPPGNPAKAKTIAVSADSVPDHLEHGDILGPCPG